MERNQLKARIFGNDYVLRSARPDEEMRTVVAYVQKKIDEAASEHTKYNKTMQATLACINMADEYFQIALKAEEEHGKLASHEAREQELEQTVSQLKEQISLLSASNEEKEERLQAVQQNLERSENKRLELAKQFQEYQRTHR